MKVKIKIRSHKAIHLVIHILFDDGTITMGVQIFQQGAEGDHRFLLSDIKDVIEFPIAFTNL